MVYGHSKNIGLDGLAIALSAMPLASRAKVSNGDTGLLTLRFMHRNKEKSLKLQCQVTHMLASGLGLSIRFYELAKQDQQLLGQIISSGSANIDNF